MAQQKKSSSNGWSYNRIAGVLALVSVFITGTIYFINLMVKLFDGSFNGGILSLIANLFMLISIVMVSWKALKGSKLPGKRVVWIVLYWVFVILAFVGQISLVK